MYGLWLALGATFIFWLTLLIATPRIETKLEELIDKQNEQ